MKTEKDIPTQKPHSTSAPEGFKQTEVGVIPVDWEVRKLGSVSDIKTGPFGSSLHERDYVNDGTPIITVEHLGEFGIIHDNMPMVSDTDKKRLNAYSLQTNDIVFSRVGSVDRNSIVGRKENGWLFSGRLLRIRVKSNNIFPRYLSYHFHQETFKQRIRSVAVGQTMASLNTQILKEIHVITPPTLTEQRAIAAALSDMDALIEAQEKLIAKKRAIKQGAMQELLKPKEGWEVKRLGDMLAYEQPTKYLVKRTEYNLNTGTPVLTAGKSFFLGFTNESDGVFKDSPVIIFDDFTTSKQFVDFDFKVKSSALKILKTVSKDYNLIFLYSLMKLIRFDATDHKRYWISEYQNIEIKVPSSKEQTRIARILSDMDTEIAQLEAQLDKYRQVKQGMMQELLTGKKRLIPGFPGSDIPRSKKL